MVNPSLPRSHSVKEARTNLDSKLEIFRTPAPVPALMVVSAFLCMMPSHRGIVCVTRTFRDSGTRPKDSPNQSACMDSFLNVASFLLACLGESSSIFLPVLHTGV